MLNPAPRERQLLCNMGAVVRARAASAQRRPHQIREIVKTGSCAAGSARCGEFEVHRNFEWPVHPGQRIRGFYRVKRGCV